MLRVEVTGGSGAGVVAGRLREVGRGALEVLGSTGGFPAALVVAVGDGDGAADVVLDGRGDLAAQVQRLWVDRLKPWAAVLAGAPLTSAPASIHPYDPSWPAAAGRRLARVRAALADLSGTEGWSFDHIGSTAVPDLAAKAVLDLQVTLPRLPEAGVLDAALLRVGLVPAPGSRPDSSGVHRDVPRGSERVDDAVWAKRLFVAPDPSEPSILHVRLAASPFGRHVVAFRDWLTAHPAERQRYEELKRALAAQYAGDADYDDYTRGKTPYLDEVQPVVEEWSTTREQRR